MNGRPTHTEEEPVSAKMTKIRISFQRASTNHLFSSFLMQTTQNSIKTNPIASPIKTLNQYGFSNNLGLNFNPI